MDIPNSNPLPPELAAREEVGIDPLATLEILQQHVAEFFGFLGDRLATADVPELIPAVKLAQANPEAAATILGGYIAVIDKLATLDDAEMASIEASRERLAATGGHSGSASETTAVTIVSALSEDGRESLAEEAAQSVDVRSPYIEAAVEDFIARTEGGHQLKVKGKTPTDGDPESDGVIWGHTQITNETTMLNFAVCHYLERYLSQILAGQGLEFAATAKDYFLNAMTDVITLDHFADRDFAGIFEMWSTPRTEGGLGWIGQDRIAAFTLPASE